MVYNVLLKVFTLHIIQYKTLKLSNNLMKLSTDYWA